MIPKSIRIDVIEVHNYDNDNFYYYIAEDGAPWLICVFIVLEILID